MSGNVIGKYPGNIKPQQYYKPYCLGPEIKKEMIATHNCSKEKALPIHGEDQDSNPSVYVKRKKLLTSKASGT